MIESALKCGNKIGGWQDSRSAGWSWANRRAEGGAGKEKKKKKKKKKKKEKKKKKKRKRKKKKEKRRVKKKKKKKRKKKEKRKVKISEQPDERLDLKVSCMVFVTLATTRPSAPKGHGCRTVTRTSERERLPRLGT